MVIVRTRTAATLSFIGTFAIVTAIALANNTFHVVLRELWQLVTFQADAIKVSNTSFPRMIAILCAALVVEYVVTIGAVFVQACVAGPNVGRDRISEFDILEELRRSLGFSRGRSLYRSFIGIMLLEELYARSLFLYVFPMYLSISVGSAGWYVLFAIGNVSWALIHLWNFEDTRDRHPIRTLPQFVSGIIFTYVFLKWGFVAALLTHIGANSLLFCTHKKQRVTAIDVVITVTWLAIGCWAWSHLEKPITDIFEWFREHPRFELSGWGRQDYVYMTLTLAGFVDTAFGLLLYDRHNVLKSVDAEKRSRIPHPRSAVFTLAVGAAATPVLLLLFGAGTVFGLRLLTTVFAPLFPSVPMLLVFVALLWSLRIDADSLSAISRIFWTMLPAIYITTCVVLALGEFWEATYYVVEVAIWTLPIGILKLYDD